MRQARGHLEAGFLHQSVPGVAEQAAFLGGDQRVFSVMSRPSSGRTVSRIGLVLCPSIAHELVKNYRREVLIARALGAMGVPAARLQYRGTGNSDGDPAEMSYDSMREDVLLVAEHLLASSGATEVVFMGSRFGTLVAASAATASGGAPMVCIEPVLSADRYVKEGFRAKLMQGIGRGVSGSSQELAAELAAVGSVDVIGVPLFRLFCESWAGKTMSGELVVPAPVLLVHLGGQRTRGGATGLGADLQERGFRTSIGYAEADESWWYLDERELLQIGVAAGAAQAPAVEPAATSSLVGQVISWVEQLAAA